MAGNLTKWEVAEFKEAFALIDTNKDGRIESSELQKLAESLGENWDDKERKGLIDEVDELQSDVIDFPSFLKMFQHTDDENPLEMLDEAFKLIAGGSDIIRANELIAFLGNVGQPIIQMEADEMVKLNDTNGKGGIDLDSFKKLWIQTEKGKK